MPPRKAKPPTTSPGPTAVLWERAAPQHRPAPEPLSRERIVNAAITIADAQGLEAVSLRNVASALGAGPMRLYGFMDTKEELLDLMVDAMYAEMGALPAARTDWRRAMRSLAQRTRRVAKQHAWFVDLVGGRPPIGPNGLAHLEQSLAALTGVPGFEDIDTVMLAVGTVEAFVVGALRQESNELRAERATGLDETSWQRATKPYLDRMIATGRFPTLARVMEQAKHPSADTVFEQRLECVLDGIEARLARPTRRR